MQKDNYFVPPRFVIEGAAKMMQKKYPPLEFLVDGLLPKTSLVTLNANPKTGKSLWTEQLAITISDENKNEFIGHKVIHHGKVLLLALEDTQQRLADRFRKQGIGNGNNALQVCTRWTSGNEGVKDLDVYLTQNPETALVVVDTLQHFRASPNATDYAEDYRWMNSLKKISDEKGICIILVHHLRKTNIEGEDEINQISGSMGIAGVADTNIILVRNRRSLVAEMKVTGRDMADYKENLKLSTSTLTWSLLGSEDSIQEEKITPERQAILDVLKKLGGSGTPKEIAEIIHDEPKNTSNKLSTMVKVGLLTKSKTKSGIYLLSDFKEKEENNE